MLIFGVITPSGFRQASSPFSLSLVAVGFMSRHEDLFRALTFGAHFNSKTSEDSMRRFRRGRESRVQDVFQSGAVDDPTSHPFETQLSRPSSTSLLPSSSLNFFNDPSFTPSTIPPANRRHPYDEEDEDEETLPESDPTPTLSTSTTTIRELYERYGIRVRVSGALSQPLPRPVELFSELSTQLRPYLLRNIVEVAGFPRPTPVQMVAIPLLLQGVECVFGAPTGSGKTLSYVIPVLTKLGQPSRDLRRRKRKKQRRRRGQQQQQEQAPSSSSRGSVRSLIVAPTKVLVDQILREFSRFGRGKRWKIRDAGAMGSNITKAHVDVLVGTPSKLSELIRKRLLHLGDVELLYCDEADRLFDMGFVRELDLIVATCEEQSSKKVQRALFSATVPLGVEHLAQTFLREPMVSVFVGTKNAAPGELISQRVEFVTNEEGKFFQLRQFLLNGSPKPPILVFVNRRKKALSIHRRLLFDLEDRIDYATADRPQSILQSVLTGFRTGRVWVLICTDVMARGLDIVGVSCVINYDCPRSPTEYVHRVGRTGRAGRQGEARTYVSRDDLESRLESVRAVVEVMQRSGHREGVPEWLFEEVVRRVKRGERAQRGGSESSLGKRKRRKRGSEEGTQEEEGGEGGCGRSLYYDETETSQRCEMLWVFLHW